MIWKSPGTAAHVTDDETEAQESMGTWVHGHMGKHLQQGQALEGWASD